MYGGAQVIGAAGLSQGDQNFPGTPALLPGLLPSSFSSLYFSLLFDHYFQFSYNHFN
jgi:hypothetical protein